MGVDGDIMRILLQAPIFTSSGYGEHSRLVLRSLLAMNSSELDIYIEALPWGATSWSSPDKELNEIAIRMYAKNEQYKAQFGEENVKYDMQIHVGIPNEFKKRAPHSVCVTAGIESDKVSAEWILNTHRGIDKIIVPSQHAKSGFTNTFYDARDDKGNDLKLGCASPIKVVPYPHKKYETVDLGLQIDTKFNFLVVAMNGPRKNLANTVLWFLETFHDDEDVGLVLKIGQGKGTQIDKERTIDFVQSIISQKKGKKCKVYLLHGNLKDSEMVSLYRDEKINALISLTHGEGYGLPIFEAACEGLPVLATDWSAHTEFLVGEIKENKKNKTKKLFAKIDYDLAKIPPSAVWKDILVEDSRWAYPKESSYKKQLKNMKGNYGMYKKWAEALKKKIHITHEESKILKTMGMALFDEVTYDLLTPISVEQLPKISIITSVYNGDEHIEEFMENITSQTIFEEKCELVIINAASPGNEEETILKYKEKFPENIIYEKLDTDPGIYATWNHAIKRSTGTFLTNANLDDRKAPNFMETLATSLAQNASVDLVYSENYLTMEPHETFEKNTSNGQVYPAEEFSIEAMLRGNPPHCMPMWRKEIHDKNGYFRTLRTKMGWVGNVR